MGGTLAGTAGWRAVKHHGLLVDDAMTAYDVICSIEANSKKYDWASI
jgi:hypothetical protein